MDLPNEPSESFKRRNPHIYGPCAVDNPERKHRPKPALDAHSQAKHRGKRRLRISIEIIRLGRDVLDSDNLAAGAKPLRDAIARSLGIDDGDERIRWHYGQCTTDGETETIVRVSVV